MSEFARKFTSRKLWVCLIGLIVGLATALGVDASEYQQIAGYVVFGASIVTYICGEAKIDAARESAGALESLEFKIEPIRTADKPPDVTEDDGK